MMTLTVMVALMSSFTANLLTSQDGTHAALTVGSLSPIEFHLYDTSSNKLKHCGHAYMQHQHLHFPLDDL